MKNALMDQVVEALEAAGRTKLAQEIQGAAAGDGKVKVTKGLMDALPTLGETYELWDSEIQGFGVWVAPKGQRTFQLKWSLRNKTGRKKIGRFGDLTVDQARKIAQDWRGMIARGEDPAAEDRTRRKASSIEDFCTRFLKDHVKVHLKPKTAEDYEEILNGIIIPAFGKLRVSELESHHVAKWHAANTHRKRRANYALAILSKMMNLAELWGLRPKHTNPVEGIQRFKEEKRQRYLTDDELKRLGKVLMNPKRSRAAVAIVRLLLLTGARRDEIQSLTWDRVDLKRGLLKLTADMHKTGGEVGEKVIVLSEPAIEILEGLSGKTLSKYVFAGQRGERYKNLDNCWQSMRAAAQITDVHIHDLRHTFASLGLSRAGLDLAVIGAILGHEDQRTTKRYAHLLVDAKRKGVEGVGRIVIEKMGAS